MESDTDIIDWIKIHCFSSNGSLNNRISLFSWWKNKGYEKELNSLLSETSWLTTENITQRIYHLINNINEIPKCKVCGKDTHFKQFKSGYFNYCSNYCVTQSEERNQKISKNNDWKALFEKQKQNNLEKYGVEHYYQTEEFKEKAKKTKEQKYNDPYFNNMEKYRKTCLEKHGIEFYCQTEDFKEKALITKKERYPEGIINFAGNTSKGEKELLEFLNGLGITTFKPNRLNNFEIDCYSEELKFGVEYCGLYFHSEKYKDNNYHFKKMKECENIGIRLITVFEDEWYRRNNQVKEFLKAQLGVFKERIYARDCEFIEIETAGDFFERNHIQGSPGNIKYCFCIKKDEKILGMVSFSDHHRINNNSSLVLNRLAFENGHQIIGGASKLVINSIKKLKKDILTWSDNRWSTGMLYEKMGFVYDEDLSPDYSYVYNNKTMRKSKQTSTKKALNIPEDTTEHQWHLDRGIFRIYDCGKKRWKYTAEKDFKI